MPVNVNAIGMVRLSECRLLCTYKNYNAPLRLTQFGRKKTPPGNLEQEKLRVIDTRNYATY